jgi:hypothetical protein
MKKLIILLIVLFTITLGALYKTAAQLDNVEQGTNDAAYKNTVNYEIPNVFLKPMPAVPLY